QRVQQRGRLRCRRAAGIGGRRADVARPGRPDLDQLRAAGPRRAGRRTRAPAVHLRRRVLAAGPRAMASSVFTAAALAERFGLGLRGDGAIPVHGVATLAGAGPRQLSFLANPRYRSQLAGSAAGVVVVREDDAAGLDRTLLVARAPYVAFAKIAALFDPVPVASPGVHP